MDHAEEEEGEAGDAAVRGDLDQELHRQENSEGEETQQVLSHKGQKIESERAFFVCPSVCLLSVRSVCRVMESVVELETKVIRSFPKISQSQRRESAY